MKLDLHIHTSYSRDGTAIPKEVVTQCKKIGLDGLAIADHNAIEGSLEAAPLARENKLIFVRALEVSAKEGHVLAYGVKELIPRGLTVSETIERIQSAGGIAVAAHPRRFPSGIGIDLAATSRFDAIEVLNGNNSRRSNGAARRIAEKLHSAVTGGSDAHDLASIGKSFTVVHGVSTEDDVLEAIRKKTSSVGGRSRSASEGMRYSWEVFLGWVKGDLRRL